MTVFAVVELMGHRTRAGVISDAQLGGATLLRIEHPTATDHTGAEPLTEFYAPSAIFGIRPCSQDEAIRVAGWSWRPPGEGPPELPSVAEAFVDEDELDADDSDIEEGDEFDGPVIVR